ncbi:FAD-dependent oxidoreductase [Paenibacillus sp. PL2-23]|uniref:FAD-dependent oxidoreductase n=1 Tax=Paenibacillus sp. PL2-23 TaxID=2100729 RepID=UPI0030F702E0
MLASVTLWGWREELPSIAHSSSQPMVESTGLNPMKHYDVIVAGSDPEGVAAALSAARSGLHVLLVDGKGRDRLGGLITLGWLNSFDLNFAPAAGEGAGSLELLNKGIFQEWYDQLEGTSIDVEKAAATLSRMVSEEPGIDVLLGTQSMRPLMDGKDIMGLAIVDPTGRERRIKSHAVIDATQDADIAAMAGVPYTVGREDLGEPEARMAVTLVFKLGGMTDDIWRSLGKRKDTGMDKMSAWGFPDAKLYESSDPGRVALRGLNIGRQNDGTVLVNAMQLFGVDPLDPKSREQGMELGRKEAPRIVKYLKRHFKELSQLEYAGVAPELYVRESRHMQGEYRLKLADVMENRDFWDAIAYGSYDVDIQRMNREDTGAIMLSPQQYGVPFRTLVPLGVDRLLVVGRSASFDSLPHGSARVVPLGMATGQAAGAAAKLAIERGVSFRSIARSEEAIAELRRRLEAAGVDLEYRNFPAPAYSSHLAYKGLLAAVSMNMTIGGYDNNRWELDRKVTPASYRNLMLRLFLVHPDLFAGNPAQAVNTSRGASGFSLEQAASALCVMAGAETDQNRATAELLKRGWLKEKTLQAVTDQKAITNGEAFMLIRDILEYYGGVLYE